MATVESHGVIIDYEILNPERNETPVFFISGLGGIRSSWVKQLSPFMSRGPVVLHDHRGTGKSEKPSGVYSVEKMAEDIITIMDDLSIEKAHMVGTSTGGAIIQVLCIKFRKRIQSGVIASSWPKSDPYFIRQFEIRKEILLNMGWKTHNRLSSFTLYSPEYFSNNFKEIQEFRKPYRQNVLVFYLWELFSSLLTPSIQGQRDPRIKISYHAQFAFLPKADGRNAIPYQNPYIRRFRRRFSSELQTHT